VRLIFDPTLDRPYNHKQTTKFAARSLDIVVEKEFVRMRAQADFIDLP
jgi:hypothetical protein